MSVIVGLSPEFSSKELTVGDTIVVQVLFSEKVSATPADWSIVGAPVNGWMLAGGVAFDPKLIVYPDPAEPLSKISIPAVIVKSGKVPFEGIVLKNKNAVEDIPLQGILSDKVRQLVDSKKEDFHWLYPYVEYGACNDWIWFASIFVISGGILAYYLWKRKNALLTAIQRDPYKRADSVLKDLYRYTKLPSNQENWKKFSYALAGTVRKFIDHRFSQNTSERTDLEFLSSLRENPDGGADVADKAGAILREIEEVRYGQTTLSPQFFTSLLERSQELLNESIQISEAKKQQGAQKKK